MIENKLQFQIDLLHKQLDEDEDAYGLGFKVKFKNPYFSKTVKITSLSKFPKGKVCQYQYQSHPKYIQFISNNTDSKVSQLNQFINQIRLLLQSIQVKVIKIKLYQKGHLATAFKLLDFDCCCGVKVVKRKYQNYQPGCLVLFHYNEMTQRVNKFLSCLQGFDEKTVYFPIKELIIKYKIPQDLIRFTFLQMLYCYGHEIEALGTYFLLQINNMGVVKILQKPEQAQQKRQKNWFIYLHVIGYLPNLHQLYQSIQHTIHSIPIFCLKINEVRSMKFNQITKKLSYQDSCRMLDASHISIMNRHMSKEQISSFAIGTHIIANQLFSAEDRQLLEGEVHGARFNAYKTQYQLTILQIQFMQNSLLIKCHSQHLQRIVRYLKKYTAQLQRLQSKCKQFSNCPDILKQTFFKLFRSQIQKKINIKFQMRENQVYQKYFSIDEKVISEELELLKSQIISQFVYIPSLKPISNYLVKKNNFQELFHLQKNPPNCWEKNLKSIKYKLSNRLQMVLMQFDNLVNYQKQIVFILHNDLPKNSKLFQIIEENNINIGEFHQMLLGTKPCRVQKFPTPNSIKFGHITFLYFDVKKINSRHIDEDTYSCLKQFSQQKRISFIIGINYKRFIDQVFPKFLSKINEIVKNSDFQFRQMYFYTQQQALITQLQRIFINFKSSMSLVTRDLLDQWAILKMNNLKQYTLLYYWNKQTLSLPGLDSYIVYLQKNKSSKGRSLVTIPTQQQIDKSYRQYFIDFKQNRIHEVASFSQIKTHKRKNVSGLFQKLLQLIQRSFGHLQLFVAYAFSDQKQIGKQLCLNIYYTNESNQQLIPLHFDLFQMKVQLREGSKYLPFVINKNNYVEWFKILTYRKQLQVLQKCFQK